MNLFRFQAHANIGVAIALLGALGCGSSSPEESGERTMSTTEGLSGPPAPTGLTPPAGSTLTTSQVFSWSSSTGATQYRFWINGVADQTYASAALGCNSGSTCSTPAIPLVAGTSGYWYVEALDGSGNGNWTGGVSYTVAGTAPPAAPTGLTPAAGSTVATSQAFSWTASAGATQYTLWINGVVDQTYSASALGCSLSSTCTTPAISLAAGTSSYWYVEAENSAGAGNWTNGVSYTVAGIAPPGAPTGLSPVAGSTVATSQQFSWNAATGATQYRLWISSGVDQTFTAAQLGCSSSSTCTTPALPLVAGTNGYWYVESQNASGLGTWTAGVAYTVAGTPPPAAPTGLTPPAGSVLSTSQAFSWTASSGALDYTLWINGVVNQTYSATQLGCSSSSTCTTPAIALGPGTSGYWYAEAQNASGGNWSGGDSYTVPGTPPPVAPTGLTPPAGSTVSPSQSFGWTATAGATQYRFWINGVADQTYTAAQVGCASSSACATPPIALATGSSGYWYVESENANNQGSWTDGVSYTVASSQPVTPLATGLPTPFYGLSVDASNVYFTDNGNGPSGAVLLCASGGCNETPTTLASNQLVPMGVATAGGNVYWATSGSWAQGTPGGVMKCPIAGCGAGPTILASGYAFSQIAVDATNVYWIAGQSYNGTSWTNATVQRCALAGCGGAPATMYSLSGTISGLAVDASNVYWATDTGVMKCAVTGCGGVPTPVFSESFAPADSAAIASDGTNVYWSNYSAGTVEVCPVSGCGTPTQLASNQNYPTGIAVDSSHVYWGSIGAQTLVGCAVGGCGGTPSILVTNQAAVSGIVLDATSVYWTSQAPPSGGMPLGAVIKTAKL